MRTLEDLRRCLRRIDGRSYPAYRDLAGDWELAPVTLFVDRVQGDPFAAPSRVRVRLDRSVAGIPAELSEGRTRCVALADFLARRVAAEIHHGTGTRRGSGKSGLIGIDTPGQEVLERAAIVIAPDWVEARLEVGLPAAGRRVLGREAEALLADALPRLAERALSLGSEAADAARDFVDCVENQEHLRARLDELEIVAFVADGSVLPRESGASDRPLREGAVPFRAPKRLARTVDLLHPVLVDGQPTRTLSGLGVPRGVTLVVGGGYHGKSTLLRALERGVYPHVPGDGREYVVTSPDAVKIRAEDGRRVEGVDIHGFIADLPHGRPTRKFSSDDASGSTSQAANIAEALEAGARVLLLDEDTSATNFMVRDARMQALVRKNREPITPFIDRVRELFDRFGVSTVLVMGGCGDYFDVADSVIRMDAYQPEDVTAAARRVARSHPTSRRAETPAPLGPPAERAPLAQSLDPSRGRREVKIDARERDAIRFGEETIDLRAVEQLVSASQARAIGLALYQARERWMDGKRTLREILDALEAALDAEGLDPLDPGHRDGRHPGRLARPRRYELAAAANRLRSLRVRARRTDPAP